MADEQNTQQDGSKTLVSFAVGLLIGGMLVWAFSGPTGEQVAEEAGDMVDEAGDMVEDGAGAAGDTISDMMESADDAIDDVVDTQPTLPVGDGSVEVNDQPAGGVVAINRATFPVSEGWIGVQDYNEDTFGTLLGVVQFSESAGIVPEDIALQFPTTAGRQYAIVVYESDGVRGFSAGDNRIDQVFDTFVAQ